MFTISTFPHAWITEEIYKGGEGRGEEKKVLGEWSNSHKCPHVIVLVAAFLKLKVKTCFNVGYSQCYINDKLYSVNLTKQLHHGLHQFSNCKKEQYLLKNKCVSKYHFKVHIVMLQRCPGIHILQIVRMYVNTYTLQTLELYSYGHLTLIFIFFFF